MVGQEGISEKQKWTVFRQQCHWVLLVIDKDSADRQMEQQKFINEVADRLEHRQEEVQKGLEQITLILNNTIQVYSDQVNQIGKLIRVIDQKVENAGAQTKQEYAAIKNDIGRLASRQKAYAEQANYSQERQQARIEFLVRQNNELKRMQQRVSQ